MPQTGTRQQTGTRFALVDLYKTPSILRGVAPGDVTGDGRPDFVLQDLDNGMTLLTNDGAPDPTFSLRDPGPGRDRIFGGDASAGRPETTDASRR